MWLASTGKAICLANVGTLWGRIIEQGGLRSSVRNHASRAHRHLGITALYHIKSSIRSVLVPHPYAAAAMP